MEEINRLTKLVEDLRYTFESKDTNQVLNKRNFNLSQELENIISTFKPIYKSKNYYLELAVEKDIEIVMDRDKLKTNYVQSAFKFHEILKKRWNSYCGLK